jgi:hypothetical protein
VKIKVTVSQFMKLSYTMGDKTVACEAMFSLALLVMQNRGTNH